MNISKMYAYHCSIIIAKTIPGQKIRPISSNHSGLSFKLGSSSSSESLDTCAPVTMWPQKALSRFTEDTFFSDGWFHWRRRTHVGDAFLHFFQEWTWTMEFENGSQITRQRILGFSSYIAFIIIFNLPSRQWANHVLDIKMMKGFWNFLRMTDDHYFQIFLISSSDGKLQLVVVRCMCCVNLDVVYIQKRHIQVPGYDPSTLNFEGREFWNSLRFQNPKYTNHLIAGKGHHHHRNIITTIWIILHHSDYIALQAISPYYYS